MKFDKIVRLVEDHAHADSAELCRQLQQLPVLMLCLRETYERDALLRTTVSRCKHRFCDAVRKPCSDVCEAEVESVAAFVETVGAYEAKVKGTEFESVSLACRELVPHRDLLRFLVHLAQETSILPLVRTILTQLSQRLTQRGCLAIYRAPIS